MATKKPNTRKKPTGTKKTPRIAKNNLANKSRVPSWLFALLIVMVVATGIYFVYRSFAAAKPNLRFQILKNGTCVNTVNNNDKTVNIKIFRDTGTAQINNIKVFVDGSLVTTNPSSINGPVSNLLIASPTLSDNPSPHTITVTGNNVSNGSVSFNAYCEANGSTNNRVAIGYNVPNQGTNNIIPSTESGNNNVRYDNFNVIRRYRTWEQTKMYDLDTLREVRVIPALTVFNISRMAYVGGGLFYSQPPSEVGGKNYGFFVNTAYEVNQNGRAVNRAGNELDMRNNMPLSNHRTSGGECTSSRIWHQGLNNNLVAAIQRAELHLGRDVPMVTALRTYEEQTCLYNKYVGTSQPVAAPGTSNHNRGLAVDVDRSWISTANNRAVLRQYKLCETVANDPGHVELCPGFK